MSKALLEFEGIEKAFFGVKVLKGIRFTVPEAGAVGLVGENGAGKSTLMNILGGNMAPNAGRMLFAGSEYHPRTPKEAEHRGIAFIHQELNLFPNLTIAENIFITRFPRRNGTPLIDRSAIHRRAAELLAEVGLEAAPDQPVETLSTGERQLVEIAKALSVNARLILFDEPTTSLTARESERLFDLIGRLRARGVAFIYISHHLGDAFRLCEQIVVLRDGEVVGTGAASSFTHGKLVSLMIGREISQLFPTRAETAKPGEPLLEVRNVSSPGKLENVSLTLRRGEVVGLAGLMGAGRSELARSIFGLDARSSGSISIGGETLQRVDPRETIRRGVGFLTENRGTEGLCLNFSVAENLSLASWPRHAGAPFLRINGQAVRAAIARIRAVVRVDAKAADTQPVRTLSGGNQQKVVLGKWLLNEPKVLILDEPTRGIDVGAKFEIYQIIHKLAEKGAALLVISSDLEELIGICDRILTVRGGQIVHETERGRFNREEIMGAALGAEGTEGSKGS